MNQLSTPERLIKLTDFSKMTHVQDIKYHPMDHKPDYVCIVSRVLPSIKKDRVYGVTIVRYSG